MILTEILRKQRCWPWLHEWRKIAISGGWGRELWRCKRCPAIKAKGE